MSEFFSFFAYIFLPLGGAFGCLFVVFYMACRFMYSMARDSQARLECDFMWLFICGLFLFTPTVSELLLIEKPSPAVYESVREFFNPSGSGSSDLQTEITVDDEVFIN